MSNLMWRIIFVFFISAGIVLATPAITSVTAQSHRPWDGKVDISYTLTENAEMDMELGLISTMKVSATDEMTGETYEAASLGGDTSLTAGTHTLIWDMAADGLDFISSNVVFTIACEMAPATYCVIDLSAGASASSYPVYYLVEPPSGGFNVDEYKTTKLVLRRIEPGTFRMCGQYQTTLTKPHFIGVFEMTQKQYSLVMGSNPSYYKGDKRPVDSVSYNMIRGSSSGANWPSSDAVDSASFIGKLRLRTGLGFDLPTEAQWEYSCRAGTSSTYNNGGSSEGDLGKLGRYDGNRRDGKGGYSEHTVVGSYLPNAWGLYDMHGNVDEWCLDWYASNLNGGSDPKGASSGTFRVMRGGNAWNSASLCTSSHRIYQGPVDYNANYSFRIARAVNMTSQEISFENDSCPVSIGSPNMPAISPQGGVVASWPLSVSMSCATEGATIHYTTDGTEPTAVSTVYSRFRITGRTTVKAVAIKNGVASEVAVAEFAAGQCADPVISPAGGTTFEHVGAASLYCVVGHGRRSALHDGRERPD